jgi:hypothetical protein
MRRALSMVAAILASLVIPTTTAHALPTGFYSVPYSGTLYQHDDRYRFTFQASFESWRQAGFPVPRPAPTDIVKYPWADDIYAVTFFEDGWIWRHLTADEWARTGYRPARHAGFIEGTEVYKWETSNELFARTSFSSKSHKLTFDEWQAMGRPEPEYRRGGYANLWWMPNGIAKLSEYSDSSYSITYGDWLDAGQPTPQARGILPGDRVCRGFSGNDLRYSGSTYYGTLTIDQWAATGYLSPAC